MTFLTSLNREGEGANALPSPLEAFTMIDLTSVKDIEVKIDRNRYGIQLWVNIEGVCQLRAYRIEKLFIDAPEFEHLLVKGAR